jgi:hypothetical protein
MVKRRNAAGSRCPIGLRAGEEEMRLGTCLEIHPTVECREGEALVEPHSAIACRLVGSLALPRHEFQNTLSEPCFRVPARGPPAEVAVDASFPRNYRVQVDRLQRSLRVELGREYASPI